VVHCAPEVKVYQEKTINGLAEVLKTADMSHD
jgi:hypothetical protein